MHKKLSKNSFLFLCVSFEGGDDSGKNFSHENCKRIPTSMALATGNSISRKQPYHLLLDPYNKTENKG